jgi:uncharacterized protein YegP (UPF0339 family)
MSARQPRFEVVHSDAGWFARFVARNGQKVWQTEVYQRQGKAVRAVELVTGHEVYGTPFGLRVSRNLRALEVRDVDERGKL